MKRLKEIKKLDALINEKIRELDRLKTLATKVNHCQEGDRVKTSPRVDALSSTVAKIVDLQHEISDQIDAFVDLKAEVMKLVDELDDSLMIDILYKRYFEYKTLECIADECLITRQWVSSKLSSFWECYNN